MLNILINASRDLILLLVSVLYTCSFLFIRHLDVTLSFYLFWFQFIYFRCTVVYGTPTMYVDLLHNYKSQQHKVASLKQGALFFKKTNYGKIVFNQQMHDLKVTKCMLILFNYRCIHNLK